MEKIELKENFLAFSLLQVAADLYALMYVGASSKRFMTLIFRSTVTGT